MRRHLRGALILAALFACAVPSAVSASASPSELLASIVAAARSERSVHYVSQSSFGTVRVGQVGDAGVTRGIQRITFHDGSLTGHVTVIVVANTAYIRGDAFALVAYIGFKHDPAARYSGAWVLIPRTDRAYSRVAAAVRLSSAIDELKVSPPLSRVADATIDGQRVVGVKGTVSSGPTAPATLYARAHGAPLPVKETVRLGANSASLTLSRWNERIDVAAPRGAVPISKTGLE